jgi:hypothetical protein
MSPAIGRRGPASHADRPDRADCVAAIGAGAGGEGFPLLDGTLMSMPVRSRAQGEKHGRHHAAGQPRCGPRR